MKGKLVGGILMRGKLLATGGAIEKRELGEWKL